MNIIFSLSISLLILLLTCGIFIGCRVWLHKWFQAIPTLGIFISGFVSFIPLNEDNNLFITIISSILDSVKLFVLENSYLETIANLTYLLGYNYLFGEFVFALLYVSAPICTAVIILSLISDYLIYARLKIPTTKNKYVFSSLNEKTLALSQSMKKNGMVGLYIFCSVERSKREQNILYDIAKKNNFIVIERNILSIPPAKKKDTLYFVISDNSSENLDITLSLMEKHQDYKNVKIFITSNEAEDEALLDNKNMKLKNNNVNLRHINETQLMAYELLQENPLYNAIQNDGNHISMLIIGGGKIGREILKNSLWCSQSLRYTFDVTVIDKNIQRVEGIFTRQCPAIKKDDYNILFHHENIDADTDEIIKFIENNNGKYNYIVIATSNDETNIKTAFDLQSWYMRNNHDAIISVNVRDEQKYNLITKVKSDQKYTTNVQLFPFGCNILMYSYEKIIDSALEKMAICINGIYKETYEHNHSPNNDWILTQDSVLEDWRYLKLQKRRSSMALAVFIKYIIWMENGELTVDCLTNQLHISNEKLIELAKLEHKRWCIYQLIEGFYPWDYSEYQESVEFKTGKTNNEVKRIHACITDWNTMLKIDNNGGFSFSEYDKEYVKHIPDIISGFNGLFGYQYGIINKEEQMELS